MIKSRLASIAAGVLLAFTGVAAVHADPGTTVTTSPAAPVQVKIYLENDNHNPGTVTVSCGQDGPVLHTALFNDAIGANVVETAKIYREDGGAANAANWPVIFGPVDVPIGGHVNVDLPYVAGTSYNAVAIPKGDPWPATLADIIGRLTAKPPTADNSQLLVSGYPTAPVDCPLPKPPNPCDHKPVGKDAAAVVPTCPPCPEPDVKSDTAVIVPTCVPTSEPTSKPSTKPSTSASTSASSSPSTSATSAVSTTAATTSAVPSPTGSATTAPSTGGLAHTGASVVPYAAGALLLLAAGGGFLFYGRRVRRH